MTTKTLYATGTSTADNVATLDITGPTTLVAVQWSAWVDSITDNAAAELMLTDTVASQFGVNNINDVISMCLFRSNFVTSGLTTYGQNWLCPVNVSLRQNDRLALHASIVGTITYKAYLVLWFSK